MTPLIQVLDLPTSLRFYQQLGFSILQQTPGWAWLRREESERCEQLHDVAVQDAGAVQRLRQSMKGPAGRIRQRLRLGYFMGRVA